MTTAVYIFGAPGVGKSALVRSLLTGFVSVSAHGVPYLVDARGRVVLGSYDSPVVAGTDTLSFTFIEQLEGFLRMTNPPVLIAEGDRLANDRAFGIFAQGFDTFVPVRLVLGPEEHAARLAGRGSGQKESWVSGRATKAAALSERWDHTVLSAEGPLSGVRDRLLAEVPLLSGSTLSGETSLGVG